MATDAVTLLSGILSPAKGIFSYLGNWKFMLLATCAIALVGLFVFYNMCQLKVSVYEQRSARAFRKRTDWGRVYRKGNVEFLWLIFQRRSGLRMPSRDVLIPAGRKDELNLYKDQHGHYHPMPVRFDRVNNINWVKTNKQGDLDWEGEWREWSREETELPSFRPDEQDDRFWMQTKIEETPRIYDVREKWKQVAPYIALGFTMVVILVVMMSFLQKWQESNANYAASMSERIQAEKEMTDKLAETWIRIAEHKWQEAAIPAGQLGIPAPGG